MMERWQAIAGLSPVMILCVSVTAVNAQDTVITNVRVETGDKTARVIVEATPGQLTQPGRFTLDKTVTLTIPNARLQLPTGVASSQANPTPKIAFIEVVQQDADVQIRLQGTTAAPEFAVETTPTGIVLNLTPGAVAETPEGNDDEEEVVVQGDRRPSAYQTPRTTTGTRTDTPLIDVPQAIQVVPQQVIEDRGIRTIGETLRNVSGVSSGRVSPDAQAFSPVIRGFQSENVLRNGLRDSSLRFSNEIANIERVEVLKGPASVLFGQGDLGGTINVVTKRPLDRPFYLIGYQVGSFDRHRPFIDFSTPFDQNGAGFRFNAAYERSNSFKPFERSDSIFIAPVVEFVDGKTTRLTAGIEYLKTTSSGTAPELPASGTVIPNRNGRVKLDANLGEPSLVRAESNSIRLGYTLEHQFSPSWSIRNELAIAVLTNDRNDGVLNIGLLPDPRLPDRRRLQRVLSENPSKLSSFIVNTALTGKFNTGSVQHQLLFGTEFYKERYQDKITIRTLNPIDVFNPVYSPQSLSQTGFRQTVLSDFQQDQDLLGFYIQDQITLFKNLIFVAGGRLDIASLVYEDAANPTDRQDTDTTKFSPRLGLVFKPTENISLYASYAQSFKPLIGRESSISGTTGTRTVGDFLVPETGTQYEVGVKANLFKNRLTTTLAYYNLERRNVRVDLRGDVLQIGAQRSRGVELDLAGQILPGWNIIAGYAYTDAQVTEDRRPIVGNRLINTPEHTFSIWTTYELQAGPLKGLGAGVGVYTQGKRPGDLENTFNLPSYWRTDAALFYRRDRLRLALNVQNLFNIDYFEGSRDINRVIVGSPRGISGTISWEF
jgi:iron complex outermembrane recepter protein